jgi:cell division protein FtsB
MPPAVEPRSTPRVPERPEPLRRRQPLAPAPAFLLGRRVLNYVLIFVTIVLIVEALVGDKGLVQTLRARRQHADATAALDGLRDDNARLREEIRRLREDPGTIESIARQDLGLIRPGELLFVIRDATHQPAAPAR